MDTPEQEAARLIEYKVKEITRKPYTNKPKEYDPNEIIRTAIDALQSLGYKISQD